MTRLPGGAAIRARAFAKINLTLRVLGVRPDGYHELRTAFQSLALHDTLTLRRANEFAVACDDPRCPVDATNLVWRAAAGLWRACGRRGTLPGVHIEIRKRIPMQAGLGGGSSDAAAALRAFAVMWKAKDAAVHEVAAGLGADVPFFLEGGTALGVERGDVLFLLADWPASWVVLAWPDFGVSTKDAYDWFDAGSGAGFPARARKTGSRPRFSFPEMWNDLQPPVVAQHGEIGRLVHALDQAGASYAAMSGSGSAVFGLFDSRARAEKVARALRRASNPAVVTRTLGRTAYASGSRPTRSKA